MKLRPLLVFYGQTYLVDDETFYGKGVKKAIPEREKFLEHLARKIAVFG